MPKSDKQHKDRLFKFVFGNPEHKEWTLSLYNALNNSHYTNPEDIIFNTIDDVIYLGMKNDISFIVGFILCIWEHQSSYNPNLPVRFLIYVGRLYDKYLTDNNIYRYGTVLHKLPKPKCVCFYNGTADQPEELILKLSDAFEDDGIVPDIELNVRMVNVNYGRNEELMSRSNALEEYAWFIDAIRRNQLEAGSLEGAVNAAIDEMPEGYKLKKFLLAHKAEVIGMYLTEYDEEKELQLAQEETRAEEKSRFVAEMLKRRLPLSLIKDISLLSEEVILNIARSLGVAVIS